MQDPFGQIDDFRNRLEDFFSADEKMPEPGTDEYHEMLVECHCKGIKPLHERRLNSIDVSRLRRLKKNPGS